MGDLRLDREERAERLAEIERELDDELGLHSTVETATTLVPRKKPGGLTWGKAILYGIGALLAIRVLMWVVHAIVPLLLLVLLIGGVFWLIGLLTKDDHDDD